MTIGTTYETDVHVPHIMDVARRTIIIAVYSPINTILMLQRAAESSHCHGYFKVLFTTCVCILIF